MSVRARLRSMFEGVFRRRQLEGGMEDEMRFHRERYAADLVRAGMTPAQAELQARREFGPIGPLKEQCREARGLRLLDEAAQDVRYAVRILRRSPVFTATAIVTLAIGIGANTAIFTIVDRFVLRALPYPNPDALAAIYTLDLKRGDLGSSSAADLLDWRRDHAAFDAICGWTRVPLTLTGGGEAEPLWGVTANAEFLPMLGAQPVLGRGLTAQDEAPGAPRAGVIGAGLWRRRFGASPDVIGRTLQLDGAPVTVVGVLPDDFRLPIAGDVDVWMTPVWTPSLRANRRALNWNVLARIRPGLSLRQARQSLRATAAAIAAENPGTNRYRGVELRTLRDEIARSAGNEQALTVFGLAGCVLLIACFNVANLQLGRAIARQKEIAVRLGIGAGRFRLMRQLIVENVVLFAAGALASAAIAIVFTRWLANAIPPFVRQYLPFRGAFAVDARALAYTLLAGVATGVVFGLAPALECRRLDITRGLKEAAVRASHSRARNALIVAEIALAMLVLISAGLLGKGLLRMQSDAPGFDPRGLATASVFTGNHHPTNEARLRFFEDVIARLAAAPGIESAAAATVAPFLDDGDSSRYRLADAPAGSDTRRASFSIVTPGYFHTLRIPLLRGRAFTSADRAGVPRVAIIDEAMANREWPGANPIGRRFTLSPDYRDVYTVIGVAGNTLSNEHEATAPQIYAPYAQLPWPTMILLARSAMPGRNAVPEIRRAVAAADPSQAVTMAMTMEEAMWSQRAPYAIAGQITACFAAIAILLAATGIYGVTAYAANARRREFGIRMALGAPRRRVIALVLRRGLALAMAGLAIGIAAAAGATRLLLSLLYHVKPTDAPTFVWTSAFLAAVTALACYLPARRAAHADPRHVLREE